jgi:large subunit ribosomal protein L29
MSKTQDFRNQTVADLEYRVDELRTELFNLRLKNTTKEQTDTSVLRHTRRDLARAMTILAEKRTQA